MIRRYDLDDLDQYEAVLKRTPVAQAFPRRSVYGRGAGAPFGEVMADKLLAPADYKAAIANAHESQSFPMYHQKATWGGPGFRWNQNGLNYCWAWSATAALKDCRAREGKPVPPLSPVSMGWTVNFRNVGNYLEDGIKALRERGVCEMTYTPDQHSLRPTLYKSGWEENARLYRLDEVWDTDSRTMIQHCVTHLCLGYAGYIAYNWWGHALELVGLRWDESAVNNLVFVIRNSHDEDDLIELTGAKAVPSENWVFRSTALAA